VDYHPYLSRDDGRLPMSDFGGVHRFNVTGLYHDMWGVPSDNPRIVHGLIRHLIDKIENNVHRMAHYKAYDLKDADRVLASYGCAARSALHVIENLRARGERIGLLELQTLWPFPGCSSRIAGYLDFHTLHTLHGRALAFATGVKLSRPELNVIVPMGDGDALAIGGNHFIHTARRNINITALVMNNRIYGMTGGQFSPLSGAGTKATTAPFGNIDQGFDVVELARAAGATFVARTSVYHVREVQKQIARAIAHPGVAVMEVMSQCPTYFGRKNKQGSAVDMMKLFKERTASIGSKPADAGKILRGVFVEEQRPEYCARYDEIICSAMAN